MWPRRSRAVQEGTRASSSWATVLGDAAEMAMIELVDFNTTYTKENSTGAAKKTRRTRRTSAKTTAPKDDAPAADAPEEPKAE